MSESSTVIANHWNESTGVCECCGHTSKKIWGDLSLGESCLAVYFVHWTVGRPEHYPNIDLIVGAWGEEANPKNRFLVSLLYRPSVDGGSFMVVDAKERAHLYGDLFGRAMLRVEVVGTPLASEVFGLVDAIWLTEPQIEGVKELNRAA